MYQVLVSYPGKGARVARDNKISKIARRIPTSSGYSPITRTRDIRFDFRRLGPAVSAYDRLARQVRLTSITLTKATKQ